MESNRSSEDFFDSLMQSKITFIPDPNTSGSDNAGFLDTSDLSIFSGGIDLQGLVDFNSMPEVDTSIFPILLSNPDTASPIQSSSLPTMSGSSSTANAHTKSSSILKPRPSLSSLGSDSKGMQASDKVSANIVATISKHSAKSFNSNSASNEPLKHRKTSKYDKDNYNPQTTSDGKPRKHIRRACLECRKRHIRCDGGLPVCIKCHDNNRSCHYVESHRGGLRIPKNKQKLLNGIPIDVPKKPFVYASPCMLDTILSNVSTSATTDSSIPLIKFEKVDKKNRSTNDFSTTSTYTTDFQQDKPNTGNQIINHKIFKDLETNNNFSQHNPAQQDNISQGVTLRSLYRQNEQISFTPDIFNKNTVSTLINNSNNKNILEIPSYDTNSFDRKPLNSENTINSNPNKLSDSVSSHNLNSSKDLNVNNHSSYENNHLSNNSTSTNGIDPRTMPFDTIVDIYYSSFHTRHPLLPPQNKFYSYIQSVRPSKTQDESTMDANASDPRLDNELVMAMAYVSHDFALTRPPNLEQLAPYITHVFQAIQRAPDDIIKVQAALIFLLGAHLATENLVSAALREWLFNFLYDKLSIYNYSTPIPDTNCFVMSAQCRKEKFLDESDTIGSSTLNIPVSLFLSSRSENLDTKLVEDAIIRSVHEAFVLDVMFSLIGRTPLSRFSESGVVDTIPVVNVNGFAYSARYRTVKVARSILQTLSTVGSGLQSSSVFSRLEALITTFQGFLQEGGNNFDPTKHHSGCTENDSVQFPPLVNDFGIIDDGIHQAIIVINFAAIILHFSFSNLYQNRIPSYVECINSSDCSIGIPQNESLNSHRATMCTKKCIEAANNLVQIISDVGIQQVCERTPLFSCALSMAMLVHMKAYHWLVISINSPPAGILGKETVQKLTGEMPGTATWDSFRNPSSHHHHHPDNGGAITTMSSENEATRQSEINLYESYIKMESSTLQLFSKRWVLPGKLNTSLCNVMFSVLPELYERTVEIKIRNKRKAREDGEYEYPNPVQKDKVIERDCWMKNLNLDSIAGIIDSNKKDNLSSPPSTVQSDVFSNSGSYTPMSDLSNPRSGKNEQHGSSRSMKVTEQQELNNSLSSMTQLASNLGASLHTLGSASSSSLQLHDTDIYQTQPISLEGIPAEIRLDIFDQVFNLDNMTANHNKIVDKN